MAKHTIVKPPDWSNPENAKVRNWCIENGITISTFATTPGFYNKTWEIQINVNGRKITSPKEYGSDELYLKVFELYKFYYNKYNG